MDTEGVNKINSLTDGMYAKKYFQKNGLTESDSKKINKLLLGKLEKNEIISEDIEKELQLLINQYRYEKKIVKTNMDKLSNTSEEKNLIFRINNDKKNFECKNCNSLVLADYNFCPFCGQELELKNLTLYSDVVDIEKKYVTYDELKYIKLVTPAELELINSDKVDINSVGIEITEQNCPLEIKNEIISKDKTIKDDKKAREKLFNENIGFFYNNRGNFKLSYYNGRDKSYEKKFPINKSLIPKTLITENKKKLKRNIIGSQTVKKSSQETSINQKNKNNLSDSNDININYAAVLYLIDTLKNPQNPKLSDSTLSNLKITSNRKIINFLRKNNYIMNAEGLDVVILNLQQKKVKDLKKILSKSNLKVSGSKDELINRIIENLSQEELQKYSKGKLLKVTKEGQNFINNHPQVELYIQYLKEYDYIRFEKYYQSNNNLNPKELLLTYIQTLRKEFSEQLKWNKVSTTYQTEIKIFSDNQELENEIKSSIKYFICSINPWADNKISLKYSNPITQNLQKEIHKIRELSDLTKETIHEIFIRESSEIKLPYLFLEKETMYNYFMRLYNNEKLEEINEELKNRFESTNLKQENMKFNTIKEQKEIIDEVKKFFK